MIEGFKFDPNDKPEDGELMRALKRMARGEPAPTFDERLQELRNNPPIGEDQRSLIEDLTSLMNKQILLLAEQQAEAVRSGNKKLALAIAQHMTKFFDAIEGAKRMVTDKDWIGRYLKSWNEMVDSIELMGEDAWLASRRCSPKKKRTSLDPLDDVPREWADRVRKENTSKFIQEMLITEVKAAYGELVKDKKEKDILRALYECKHPLKTEDLVVAATRTNITPDSNFRALCSRLKRVGLIDNRGNGKSASGYFLTPEGKLVCELVILS